MLTSCARWRESYQVGVCRTLQCRHMRGRVRGCMGLGYLRSASGKNRTGFSGMVGSVAFTILLLGVYLVNLKVKYVRSITKRESELSCRGHLRNLITSICPTMSA
jgi:hypothetical protein